MMTLADLGITKKETGENDYIVNGQDISVTEFSNKLWTSRDGSKRRFYYTATINGKKVEVGYLDIIAKTITITGAMDANEAKAMRFMITMACVLNGTITEDEDIERELTR